MNLLQALLSTYDAAAEAGIVDTLQDRKTPCVVPLCHSNKQSLNGEDIFEITIDDKGQFLHGRFLEKGTYVIFPVSGSSVVRTSKPCPHLLCDNFSYIASPDPDEIKETEMDKMREKHALYLDEMAAVKNYAESHPNPTFKAIYDYVITQDIRRDVVQSIKDNSEGSDYVFRHDELQWKYREGKPGKEKEKTKKIGLADLFITFVVEHADKAISVSEDKPLHQFYIDYDRQRQPLEWEQCDITGRLAYCATIHRGVIGTAKLIGVSNHKENYQGKLFTSGEQTFHMGFETSQKIHGMLRYLRDSKQYNYYLGGGAYAISWMTQELQCGGAPLLAGISDDEDDLIESEFDSEETDDINSLEETVLGTRQSNNIVQYFGGIERDVPLDNNYFCVLILEKVNNGRVAAKYFRAFASSDIQRRAESWYESMKWPVYSMKKKKLIFKVPPLSQFVNFLYGVEDEHGFVCPKQSDKVRRNALERLLPCIIEGKHIPDDIIRRAFFKLQNRQSFKKQWRRALQLGCVLFKKHLYDSGTYIIDEEGVIQEMDDRSFAYGRLLAVYDKLETDALNTKKESEEKGKKDKADGSRVTNAARLWSAMIHRPLQTAAILERQTKYYQNALAKNNMGAKVYYDKLRQVLYSQIMELEKNNVSRTRPADENFVLGYYYQQKDFYRKKEQ